MRLSLLCLTFIFSVTARACLNLNGKMAGSCVYSSPQFGELEGSIEFNIQQPNCEQITLDGSSLKIPGEFTEKSIDGTIENFTKLVMNWQDSGQEILAYDYFYTADEYGKRLDDVALKGTFQRDGKKVILKQSGVVDHDPVEIYCEMF